MSTESVNVSETQAPKKALRQFNELEELGFKLSNFIKSKYPLPEGVNFMSVHDPILAETFDLNRNGSKISALIHKNPKTKHTKQKNPKQSE